MIATEFKTLVLKHKRSQITEEGDENHNETKKGENLCINFLGNNTSSAYEKLRKYTKNDCAIALLQKRYNMLFIIGKILRKLVSQL